MNALELAAGDRQVARLLGAAGKHHGVVLFEQFVGRNVDADIGAVMELHAFGLHLLDAAFDMNLFHLEVRDSVAQQAAGLGPALVDMHVMPGARELLRASQARRAGADNGDLLAGLVRRQFGFEPERDGAVGDFAFDGLDGDRVVVDVERAGRLARRRTNTAGEFGKIIGRVQIARRLGPVVAVDEVVPVRNLVVDRAAGGRAGDAAGAVAIGHAAIHTARGLVADFLFRQRQHEFVPMLDTLRDRRVAAVVAFDLEKAGDLTHAIPQPASWRPSPLPSRPVRGGIPPASLCGTTDDSVANRRVSRPRAWNWYSAHGWRSTCAAARHP